MYTAKNNKAISVKTLRQILTEHVKNGGKLAEDAPVTMSSDEEGNDMPKLVGVEISESGHITLWPARL
jgi:hypothetical protein